MTRALPDDIVIEPWPRAARVGRWLARVLAGTRRGPGRYPGGVDPIDGAVAGEPTTVTGWARVGGRDTAGVLVLVDGRPAAVAAVDPDPERVAHPRGRYWSAVVELPEGTHTVGAIAVVRDGLAEPLVGRRAVVAEPPAPPIRLRYLDHPPEGASVPLPLLTVQGWTVDDPLARVVVDVEGDTQPARLAAYARPDVAVQVDSVHGMFSGYERTVDLSRHRPGDAVTVRVTIEDADGAPVAVDSRSVVVAAAAETTAPDPRLLDWVRGRGRTPSSSSPVTAAATAAGAGADGGHHVLVVTHHLGLGGGQLYLQELLLGLLRTGVGQVTVVSPLDGELREELEAAGAAVHIAGHYPTEPVGYERLVGDLTSLGAEIGATAVLANTALAFPGIDAAGRLGLPSLWAIHESYDLEHLAVAAYGPGQLHPIVFDRLRAALAGASAVLFEAEETRRMYERHGEAARFVHVPYGVPLADLDRHRTAASRPDLRAALGYGPEHTVLLCLGTIEERKAQAALVRSFARVAGDFPHARLALVGDRGDAYASAVADYAVDLGVGDRVELHPVTPDCYDWYVLADAFVLVSDVESLPRSVLEAMGAGLPVLATSVFGLADTIEDGRTGFLVEARDLVAMEAGIRRLLALSPEERRDMGAAASSHVRADHDSAGYVAAYRRLLDGFAATPDARPGELLDPTTVGGTAS